MPTESMTPEFIDPVEYAVWALRIAVMELQPMHPSRLAPHWADLTRAAKTLNAIVNDLPK